ncbi:hypothetical protein HR060_14375 [Catenovulum sp. SM1970]|uniref:hypothetical protein n=1 Tax=Marinifaba aquimaris TaxID=2741323 RepID=UPI0015716612|nr:hypothetical protein [Marinifaba aquimaris]NTS78042.1 hypothetical protein [Marinifaba aquimaris]
MKYSRQQGTGHNTTVIKRNEIYFTARHNHVFIGVLPCSKGKQIEMLEATQNGEIIIDEQSGESAYIPNNQSQAVRDGFNYIERDDANGELVKQSIVIDIE